MTDAAAAAAAAATATAGESSWVLLYKYARVGEIVNETTTSCKGWDDVTICASLVRERPPVPSSLYLYCPDATFRYAPYSISMVDDLILFHACITRSFRVLTPLMSDFFIYRADPKRPSLEMLPHFSLVKGGDPFGIFPCGEDHYTIAALSPLEPNGNFFSLCLYDSKTKIWSSKKLSVESPQKELTVDFPIYFSEPPSHCTHIVVTLGETIGWVDLWRRIVFCNMLSKKHTLLVVPLPLPLKCIESNVDSIEKLGDASYHRGIGFINGCLRLVEVESDVVFDFPHVSDEETGWPCSRTENWTITTWTNKKMSKSYDDWYEDCKLQASDIYLGDHSESELPLVDLKNLFVSNPTVGMNENGSHVIYLTARMKFNHPKSWVLAIDTRDRKVQSVARSAPIPQGLWFVDANFCSCSISK